MQIHKIGVLWSDGIYTGIAGFGNTQQEAQADALHQVMLKSEKLQAGFKVLDYYAVMALRKEIAGVIRRDWEREEERMGQWP